MLNGYRIDVCNARVVTFAYYRRTPNYSIVTFWKARRESNFTQVGIEYTDVQLYVCMYVCKYKGVMLKLTLHTLATGSARLLRHAC